MEIHPLRNQQIFYPLWVSEATNFKNNALGIRGVQKIVEEAFFLGLNIVMSPTTICNHCKISIVSYTC